MKLVLGNWPTASVLAATLMMVSCAGGGKFNWVELKPPAAGSGPIIQIKGTVHHLDLEGGLYVIRDAEGTTFNPANLPEAFRVDGMAIEADAQRREDLVSIGMVGPIVDLVRIRERS
jgi:hypothetical protein